MVVLQQQTFHITWINNKLFLPNQLPTIRFLKIMKTKLLVATALAFSPALHASTIQASLNLSAGANTIQDNMGNALTSGVSTVNGDGALIELGYFTGNTSSFTGTWVALTGPSSNNTSLITTVGDVTAQDGSIMVPDGLFAIAATFDTDIATASNDLPVAGAQLALRFYDSTTRAASSHFNTVTSTAWTFTAPADPAPIPIDINLDSVSDPFVWQDSASPFQTTLVVPEPSSAALVGLGGLALLLRRRRA